MTGAAAMTALSAWCRCGHCGALSRLRVEGDFASCNACGKVLLELRGDVGQTRALSARRRRMKRGREGRAAGRGDMGGDVGVRCGRGAESDAKSTVTTG